MAFMFYEMDNLSSGYSSSTAELSAFLPMSADEMMDKNDQDTDEDEDEEGDGLAYPSSFLNMNIPGGLSSLLPPNMQVKYKFIVKCQLYCILQLLVSFA